MRTAASPRRETSTVGRAREEISTRLVHRPSVVKGGANKAPLPFACLPPAAPRRRSAALWRFGDSTSAAGRKKTPRYRLRVLGFGAAALASSSSRRAAARAHEKNEAAVSTRALVQRHGRGMRIALRRRTSILLGGALRRVREQGCNARPRLHSSLCPHRLHLSRQLLQLLALAIRHDGREWVKPARARVSARQHCVVRWSERLPCKRTCGAPQAAPRGSPSPSSLPRACRAPTEIIVHVSASAVTRRLSAQRACAMLARALKTGPTSSWYANGSTAESKTCHENQAVPAREPCLHSSASI